MHFRWLSPSTPVCYHPPVQFVIAPQFSLLSPPTPVCYHPPVQFVITLHSSSLSPCTPVYHPHSSSLSPPSSVHYHLPVCPGLCWALKELSLQPWGVAAPKGNRSPPWNPGASCRDGEPCSERGRGFQQDLVTGTGSSSPGCGSAHFRCLHVGMSSLLGTALPWRCPCAPVTAGEVSSGTWVLGQALRAA